MPVPAILGAGSRRPIITFTFDDGDDTDYLYAFPVFAARGVAGVSYQSLVGWGASRLTWATATEMQAAGWEIGSHTVNHTVLNGVSGWDLTHEVRDSQHYFRAMGFPCENFAYPNGAHDAAAEAEVATYYRTGRLGGSGAIVTRPIPDIAVVQAQQPVNSGFADADQAANQAMIDTAIAAKGWLIFVCHTITEDEATNIGLLIDYARSQGCLVLTMQAALDRMGVPRKANPETGNLILASEAFTDTHYWTPEGTLTVTADQGAAPVGTAQAMLITSTADANKMLRQDVWLPTTGTYTWSIYMKTVSGTASVILKALTDFNTAFGTSGVLTVNTTWTRYSVTFTTQSNPRLPVETFMRVAIDAISPGENVLIAGAMLNAGAAALSYVPSIA